MALKIEDIKQCVKSDIVFNKGTELYEEGLVSIVDVKTFWRGELKISGTVGSHKASISISGDTITQASCTCGKSMGILCVHGVALAVAYADKQAEAQSGIVYTSAESRRIVNSYLQRAINNDDVDLNNIVSPTIEVKITGVDEGIRLCFAIMIGNRRYVIKNIDEFVDRIHKNEFYEYGKNLAFKHAVYNFDERDRKLVEFIAELVEERNSFSHMYDMGITGTDNLRELVLVGNSIERFISLTNDISNPVVWNDGSVVEIEKKSPKIKISIKGIGDKGLSFEMSGAAGLFHGGRHLYIYNSATIYECDEEFSKDMYEFIRFTLNSRDKMLVGRKDTSAFCTAVIPIITKYCDVKMNKFSLEEFSPWELECEFEFDIDNSNNVIMYMKSMYGEYSLDLFRGRIESLKVCRDYKKEYQIKNLVLKYFNLPQIDGTFVCNDYELIYQLIDGGVSEFTVYGDVKVSNRFSNINIVTPPKVTALVSLEEEWLNVNLDAEGYDRDELKRLLQAYQENRNYVRLENGDFVKLKDNGFEVLGELSYGLNISADELFEKEIFIPKYRALYLENVLKDGKGIKYNRNSGFKALVRTIKSIEDSDFEVPENLSNVLRHYQKTGFRWLKTMDSCGFGGVLADDMGLGKTIEVIALIKSYLDETAKNDRKPSFIVTPASLVYNWQKEISRFSPDITTVAVVGGKSERREILNNYKSYDVVITSYDLLKRDIDMYSDIYFRYNIIDEAQFIKNYNTQAAKTVKKIKSDTRFALTGTPIENRLSELWSVFDFVMPKFLYSYGKYREKFDVPISKKSDGVAANQLRRMIAPFVLRRLKKDVLKDLPEKMEYNIYSKMEDEQNKLYVANMLELKENLLNSTDEAFSHNRIQILAQLTRLRQICCEPSLCYEDYDDGSAKLETCLELVKNAIEGGHKILLFSQFTSMLDIIQKKFEEEQISYYMLVGSTTKEKRVKMIDAFNQDETNVFLISLKAGGTGLNLTGADTIIHYEPWWNVAVQNQATDRAYRIGQTNVVSVYKLITQNSIEEGIVKLQQSKKDLADKIINEEQVSLSSLTRDDLIELLGS